MWVSNGTPPSLSQTQAPSVGSSFSNNEVEAWCWSQQAAAAAALTIESLMKNQCFVHRSRQDTAILRWCPTRLPWSSLWAQVRHQGASVSFDTSHLPRHWAPHRLWIQTGASACPPRFQSSLYPFLRTLSKEFLESQCSVFNFQS